MSRTDIRRALVLSPRDCKRLSYDKTRKLQYHQASLVLVIDPAAGKYEVLREAGKNVKSRKVNGKEAHRLVCAAFGEQAHL